jgi:hypothetical protein
MTEVTNEFSCHGGRVEECVVVYGEPAEMLLVFVHSDWTYRTTRRLRARDTSWMRFAGDG